MMTMFISFILPTQHFAKHLLCCAFHPRNLTVFSLEVCASYPWVCFTQSPAKTLPSSNHQFVLCICDKVFQIPHINEITQYLSLSDLFHLASCPQDPSMQSQMVGFPSFYGQYSTIYVYVLFFLHPFINLWTLRLFLCLNNTAVDMGEQK